MSAARSIDLNADVGEGAGFDGQLIPLVTSVNIACGAHAGDEATMRAALALAIATGAGIGAHPGFNDREHFGRRELAVKPKEAAALVLEQTQFMQRVAADSGAKVAHVKLHGALYNMVSRDPALSGAVASAIAGHDPSLILVALAGSRLVEAGRAAGLRVVGEAFADRAYLSDGSLMPRGQPGAVIEDEDQAALQAIRLATEGKAGTPDGGSVAIDAATICLHGDSPAAAAFAHRIRRDLAKAGISIARYHLAN
jgi:UPF0271 protein